MNERHECTELVEHNDDSTVRCLACNHYCTIKDGSRGKCGIRYNLDGKLYLGVYGLPSAVHVDPIEKKPLAAIHPGAAVLSLGTIGCNFTCNWCQNWSIAATRAPRQIDIEDFVLTQCSASRLSPQEVISSCQRRGLNHIAFTYNEPSTFVEYALDIMRLGDAAGIYSLYVSNGYMSSEQIDLLTVPKADGSGPLLSAINIDLKAFSEETYQRLIGGHLSPVLESIKAFHRKGVVVEVTTLVVPGLNDSDEELTQIAQFLVSVCPEIPWHISAFHPAHKMMDREATPADTIRRAMKIGTAAGLKHIYPGNLHLVSHTLCAGCGTILIDRHHYRGQSTEHLSDGACTKCGKKLFGMY
eukprot:gnl/Dysnectes_brevis/4430_a5954_621.p1 GENE.gnl/Dysnectes_brevis/4430_a5954_621~~gnl/Dysnectes_brevis/4430_a5954_621.p1  ORF type:complete len:356 (+),score=50.71 gnl/Dysnectes_brevis/4430_a5954_621:35-1102(+)